MYYFCSEGYVCTPIGKHAKFELKIYNYALSIESNLQNVNIYCFVIFITAQKK